VQLKYPPLPPETSTKWEGYPIPPSKQEIILERIGFTTTSWDQMNWYVSFAREDLSRLTAGDFLNLQEQITAIWVKLRYVDTHDRTRPLRPALPSREDVERLQKHVVTHFDEIVDQGGSQFGPYPISRFITHEVWDLDGSDEPGDEPISVDQWRHQILITGPDKDTFKNYLVTHLFDLFREHAQSIRRCPHCSRVFLQLRRSAMYCSRACQSVATMQKRRMSETVKETKPSKKGKPSRPSSKRKGAR
jgi:hypothetical protein